MPDDINAILRSYVGAGSLDLEILRDAYQVQSLEVAPEKSSPLYLENDAGAPLRLHLPCDNVIGRLTLLARSWDSSKPKFIEQMTRDSGIPFCLVDIGANVGLFSRQCLAAAKNIGGLFAYEPYPGNFEMLGRNLKEIEKVTLQNAGLGSSEGVMDFFLDPHNAGNYSLNLQAMPPGYSTVSVKVLPAAGEVGQWLFLDKPIVYKSDTQGFDETIATSLPLDFWESVRCGIFELWRIGGKSYDKEKFSEILDHFKNKVFEKNPKQIVRSSVVAEFLDATDGQYDDLLFWND